MLCLSYTHICACMCACPLQSVYVCFRIVERVTRHFSPKLQRLELIHTLLSRWRFRFQPPLSPRQRIGCTLRVALRADSSNARLVNKSGAQFASRALHPSSWSPGRLISSSPLPPPSAALPSPSLRPLPSAVPCPYSTGIDTIFSSLN